MLQQYSTALIALNSFLQNHSLYQILSHLKVQVINRAQINTKENILLDLETFKPTFLLVSSSLPGAMDLTDIVVKAKALSPRTKIILFINQNDTHKIQSYLLGNVDGIIWSENPLEYLESAIRQISKGLVFICGRTAYELRNSIQMQSSTENTDSALLNSLTEREVEVLKSLTQGVNYKQISKLLFISESTVKTHINNIFTKLNVNDRTQAVLYALKHGIDSLAKKPHILKNLTNEVIQK